MHHPALMAKLRDVLLLMVKENGGKTLATKWARTSGLDVLHEGICRGMLPAFECLQCVVINNSAVGGLVVKGRIMKDLAKALKSSESDVLAGATFAIAALTRTIREHSYLKNSGVLTAVVRLVTYVSLPLPVDTTDFLSCQHTGG